MCSWRRTSTTVTSASWCRSPRWRSSASSPSEQRHNTSAAAILSRKLLSLQNNDRFYSSFIISFTDDGAAPRSDGRVEGLDAARHPRLSHHRRQQGTNVCYVIGARKAWTYAAWFVCVFIKLVCSSGAGDLHTDPRARLVLSLPLRIRTFPLLLQQSRLLSSQAMHSKF